MTTRGLELVEQYKILHRRKEDYGIGTFRKDIVAKWIAKHGIHSVLDYGCGKGGSIPFLRKQGVVAAGYDPAVPEFELMPAGVFEGVCCNDVLEHITLEDLPELVRQVCLKATKAALFSICTRTAYNLLPNGDNCHETVMGAGWWTNRMQEWGRPLTMETFHMEDDLVCVDLTV